jgi:uncharacterized protein
MKPSHFAHRPDPTRRNVGRREDPVFGNPRPAGRLKNLALEVAGWALVAAGIAGLFLPVLQGVLFLLMGLAILASRHRWAGRLVERLQEHFPSLRARFREASGMRHAKLIPPQPVRPPSPGDEKKG